MEQIEPQPRTENGVTSTDLVSVASPPRMWRVRLWQAIAGMCMAITIWMLIVMSALIGRLARTSNFANRRVAALNATVRALRHQTASEQRKLGSERERASVGEVFEKILFAPDLRTIKLAAPAEREKEKAKSAAKSSDVDQPTGKLAMSESADAAMLEATGLKPTGAFQVYRIWWMPRHGVPIWAADFLVGDDGAAMVPVDLPTGREKGMSLGITLENESYSDEPAGPVALKGELSLMSGAAHKPRR
jgi:Anti-sigma-K factor rskA